MARAKTSERVHTALCMHGRNALGRLLADFSIPSQPGNERIAMRQVADSIRSLGLSSQRLQRLETAVSEATLNAMEHGNRFEADRPTTVRVVASDTELVVTVGDEGGAVPAQSAAAPDIDAKLAGGQSPRGWGLFLIKNMVDDVTDETDGCSHRVHLHLRLI